MSKQFLAVMFRNGTVAFLALQSVACARQNFASLASETGQTVSGVVDPAPVTCTQNGVVYHPGDVITSACAPGQIGSIETTCQTDGTFVSNGTCVTPIPAPVTCSNAGQIFQIGQSFTSACATGQTGSIVNTCQSDGSFSAQNGCVTPPPTPVTCSNAGQTFQVGQSFTSACAAGQTGSIVNTCQSNGSFSAQNGCTTPTPAPVTCSNAGQTYQIGQSFTSSCAAGQTGSIVNTCQASGSFSVQNSCTTPAPTCSTQDILVTMTTLIRSISTTEDAIAQSCGDGAVSVAQSYPENSDLAAVRFYNTCGNRYCKQVLGATSGRVIEDANGQALVSCIYDIVPQTNVSNSCQAAIQTQVQKLDWIAYPNVSRPQLAQDCVDPVIPTVDGQYPTNGNLMTRWVFTCGNRECVKQGFSAGRVIEDDGTTAYLECTREEVFNTLGGGEVARQITTTPIDVANSCVDGYFPTPQASLPQASPNNLLRFTNTCGNRYCVAQGFRQGRVNEVSDSVAIVRCTK